MTVNETHPAVEEADRLGEALLPGYKPSEIFFPDMIVEAKQQFDAGETHMWDTMTNNLYFARLQLDERERDDMLKWDWKATGLDRHDWAGAAFHVISGLSQPGEEHKVMDAFNATAKMRVRELVQNCPPGVEPPEMLSTIMWEGVLIGVMLAQRLPKTWDAWDR